MKGFADVNNSFGFSSSSCACILLRFYLLHRPCILFIPRLSMHHCLGPPSLVCAYQVFSCPTLRHASSGLALFANLKTGYGGSFAPTVLAFIFNRFRAIVEAKEPGHSSVVLPLPIIYVWLRHHFGALFQEAAPNRMKYYLPGTISIDYVVPIDWGHFDARRMFMRVERSQFTPEHCN